MRPGASAACSWSVASLSSPSASGVEEEAAEGDTDDGAMATPPLDGPALPPVAPSRTRQLTVPSFGDTATNAPVNSSYSLCA
eukprot:CAMPEP_0180065552 /NCGR_PEP_ID=MMETSP0985-20121206/8808_1 /TAXON_ID=483367 /ORGANISM="non described non described, Strain CCMP 2436" /LENGTH=81 /DNA_ID=CAMNT_0021995993 /DNA_START=169 /DNA_END=410 /DNA_ORIENTATION=+